MVDTTDITDYLNAAFALRLPPSEGRHWQPSGSMPAGVPASTKAYADILRTDAVRLGGLLTTNNGRFAAAAVHAMTPQLAQPAEQFLIEALIEVAAEQADRQRQNVALLAVGAAVLLLACTLLVLCSGGGARGSGR